MGVDQNAGSDGEVEGCAFFSKFGWGEIDSKYFLGQFKSCVFECGTYAVTAFSDDGVGESYDDFCWEALLAVDFDGDADGVDAIECCAGDGCEHVCFLFFV